MCLTKRPNWIKNQQIWTPIDQQNIKIGQMGTLGLPKGANMAPEAAKMEPVEASSPKMYPKGVAKTS